MTSEQDSTLDTRRRPGRKPYPTLSFERTLDLARGINEHSVDGRIRRLTLFQQMGRRPSSSTSRQLVSSSQRYGLTLGNYSSEYLELADEGEVACSENWRFDGESLRTVFDVAIARTPVFNSLYDQLKNRRIPTDLVLADLFAQEGIDQGDCEEAAKVFTDNVRYLGLIQDQVGSEYLIPLEQLLEDLPEASDRVDDEEAGSIEEPVTHRDAAIPAPMIPVVNEPSLHIDIQIHIDSSASPDQIEQIFASMAKHLYGREG